MDALELVGKLEERINAGDVDGLMALFAPDASVTIPALSPKSGEAEVRSLFEFCVGINVRWEFKESIATADGARSRVDQFDGWADLVGIAPLRYETFDVVVDDGRIASIEGTWSPETVAALGRSLEGFTPWAVANHSDLYQQNGDFVYTRRAGEGFIAAAREWRSMAS